MTDRRASIGASEAAAVLGLSPYKTPLDVYLEKTGDVPAPVLDSEPVYWGRALESLILQRYMADTGRALDVVQQVYRSPEHPFMTATPDAVGADRLVEIKTAGIRQAAQWGEPGTDAVPIQYLVQVTHQMIVTGHQLADMAVLIGGQDYRVYAVPLDRELAAAVIEREREFWSAVSARTPPAPTTLAGASLRWPRDTGATVVASPDVLEALARLKAVRERLKVDEADADALELAVKTCMAEATTLTDAAGAVLATWKSQSSRRFDAQAFKAAHGDLYEQFRVASASRVFRLK
jgi:putative phage-type endonuclease